MGLGAFVTGHIISIDASGVMHRYDVAGYIAVAAMLTALWVSGRITQRG
jgi:hypothetical protein